ncbi:PREDICTED: UPF0728 protein C10orf53 homolog [Mesitornis unicolor]|uniref:UPF0728 protein C10orf53 homolog n=1 Tax=Mesitornis unicolor TaxID=54374 RepID=UPI00052820F9|nr:PREDICTED: UPF0728 protein C10orf53 homolog [Mesitornis unicolor]
MLRPFPAVLQADGHQLILEEISEWNAVEQVVSGEETAFHCNITDLHFGGDGKLISLCEAARKAVLHAYRFTGTHSLLPLFSVRQFTCITEVLQVSGHS